ncbi:MAG: hypothetical protein U5R06_11050 [candidate division KSB1 bacterium]|nr:hypothetical protein [candidate division KSB1 bacterium]
MTQKKYTGSQLFFKTLQEEMVFPMVPSGAAVRDMLLHRLDPNEFDV